MTRFALLKHDHPTLHWDLMLQVGEVLWTWRLDAMPDPSAPGHAVRIADHRPLYLDYEGPVSGGRGAVKRVAGGEFDWVEDSPNRLAIRLKGKGLSGRLTLEKGHGEEWNAFFRPEE